MNGFDELTLMIGVVGLLLLAVVAGFILMWQRQKYLHAALQAAWATAPGGLPQPQLAVATAPLASASANATRRTSTAGTTGKDSEMDSGIDLNSGRDAIIRAAGLSAQASAARMENTRPATQVVSPLGASSRENPPRQAQEQRQAAYNSVGQHSVQVAGQGAGRDGGHAGSEEDRLRALLAARGAVRSNAAAPQQRPWSP